MVQSYFGCATLQRSFLLIKDNDSNAFPHLPSYQQWLARCHKLSFQMDLILENAPISIKDLDEIYLTVSDQYVSADSARTSQFAQR